MKLLIADPLIPASTSMITEAVEFPAGHLHTDQPTEVTRSDYITGDDIIVSFDYGQPTIINFAALLFHTEAPGTEIEMMSSNDDDLMGASLVARSSAFASPDDPGFPYRHGFVSFSATEARYWWLKVTGRGNQVFQAGRFILSNAFLSSRSVSYGGGPTNESGQQRSLGSGGVRIDVGDTVRRVLDVNAQSITRDEQHIGINAKIARIGQTKPAFVVLGPENEDEREHLCCYGTIERIRPRLRNHRQYRFAMRVRGL
jgi:hypothetical protein